MPNDPRAVARFLRENGGAMPLLRLEAAGHSQAEVAAAHASSRIIRVRKGWYAASDAPREVVRAARVGGALTATSVARLHGLWVGDDSMLHVRVPRTASRLRAPDAAKPGEPVQRLDPVRHRVCVHYRSEPKIESARDGLPLALAEMLRCSSRESAIATIDSALAQSELSARGFAMLEAASSPAGRNVLRGVSAGSESGIETKVRLLLRSRNIPHRSQVEIPEVGRVDLIVGDRLVIEVDGSAYHSGEFEFENDRRRDFELMMRGYLVLRLSYRMVVEQWEATRQGLLDLLARGEHRWGSRVRAFERTGARMPGLDRVDGGGPERWGAH